MKAAVFYGKGDLRLEEVDVPEAGPNDVLLKVKVSAICGTDLHIMAGRYKVNNGTIIGHEYSGLVEKAGENVNFQDGDRVIGSPIVPCGRCYFCMRSEYGLCENRRTIGTMINGSFAEYMLVPNADYVLTRLPNATSFSEGALIGDLLATAFNAVERGNVQIGDTVAVFGAGPIGMTAMMGARVKGAARIIAVDMVDDRLAFAEKKLGVDYTINPTREDAVKKITELTKGLGADVAIEAVGREETLASAVASVRRAGNVSVIGVFEGFAGVDMKHIVFKMLRVSGTLTRIGPDFLDKLASLVEHRVIDIERLVTHRFPLSKIHKGLDMFGKREDGCVKIEINP